MAVNGYFFNALQNTDGSYDRVYNAEDFSNYLNLIVGSGVFPNPSTNLQVVASTGFNIIVKAGEGWINGRKIVNTIDFTITLDESDVLLNRIDRVIFYADYSERIMGIGVLKGTPAETPVAPAITRNSSRVEYCLAEVLVRKQATTITQAEITDTRPDSTVCGWVAGLIQQVDTSELYGQWEAAYEQYFEQIHAEVNAFMEALTEDLNVNTYLVQYRKFTQLQQGETEIPLTISEYTYTGTDIVDVYLAGIMLTPYLQFTIDETVDPPVIRLNADQLPVQSTYNVYIRIFKSKIMLNSQMIDSGGDRFVTENSDLLFALGD